MVTDGEFDPYLPGFSHRLCGRRSVAAALRLSSRTWALDSLAALVSRFIPAEGFAPPDGQRDRIFTPWVGNDPAIQWGRDLGFGSGQKWG
jgi:hypothetical protein